MVATTHDVSFVVIELGLVIVGLAVLARLASRWGFSAIPLYLLAGLAFGNGGLAPLRLSENFVRTGAEIDRKSTRLNSSHSQISYAVFCLKKKKELQSPAAA